MTDATCGDKSYLALKMDCRFFPPRLSYSQLLSIRFPTETIAAIRVQATHIARVHQAATPHQQTEVESKENPLYSTSVNIS